MANLNKVMLIGRLTRDPEVRTFSNGGKVANFGFAVNNRRKSPTTGEWEEVPVFLSVKAFNRETGRKLADLVEQYLRKGSQAYIEGHLTLEQWEDKNGGGKREALKVVMEDLQFLGTKQDGSGGGMGGNSGRATAPASHRVEPSNGAGFDEPEPMEPPTATGGQEEEIPF
jgi:single-strand DNA-binding protein